MKVAADDALRRREAQPWARALKYDNIVRRQILNSTRAGNSTRKNVANNLRALFTSEVYATEERDLTNDRNEARLARRQLPEAALPGSQAPGQIPQVTGAFPGSPYVTVDLANPGIELPGATPAPGLQAGTPPPPPGQLAALTLLGETSPLAVTPQLGQASPVAAAPQAGEVPPPSIVPQPEGALPSATAPRPAGAAPLQPQWTLPAAAPASQAGQAAPQPAAPSPTPIAAPQPPASPGTQPPAAPPQAAPAPPAQPPAPPAQPATLGQSSPPAAPIGAPGPNATSVSKAAAPAAQGKWVSVNYRCDHAVTRTQPLGSSISHKPL
jgi:hypothetical protein